MPDIITSLEKCQNEVDNRFLKRKKQSVYLSSVYDALELKKRAERVRECGSYLEFRVSPLESRLYQANFCKDRLCPMCNWRRSLKNFSQISDCMNFLEKKGYRFLFLTLTMKNPDNEHLKDAIDLILDAYTRLLRKSSVKRAVHGCYRSFEITWSKETLWHPHLHVILAVREEYFCKDSPLYIKFQKWLDMWRSCLQVDYFPSIRIKAVKKGKLDFIEGNSFISYKSAIKEMTKYVVKSNDYLSFDLEKDLPKVACLVPAVEGHRFNSLSGCFADAAKELKLDDLEEGDLVHTSNKIRADLSEMVVRYHWKQGVYIQEIFDYSKRVSELKNVFESEVVNG